MSKKRRILPRILKPWKWKKSSKKTRVRDDAVDTQLHEISSIQSQTLKLSTTQEETYKPSTVEETPHKSTWIEPFSPVSDDHDEDVFHSSNPQNNFIEGLELLKQAEDAIYRMEILQKHLAPIMDSLSKCHQILHDSPKRKAASCSSEKSVAQVDAESVNEELKKIAVRISEVENLDRHVEEKIRTVRPQSEDEQRYLIEHMKLLNEKDELVRKQDYLNITAQLSKVEEKLAEVQQQINETTINEDWDKNEEEKQRNETLVEEYKALIDKKIELAEALTQQEDEEEEHNERARSTLERSQNFHLLLQEPLNTSQRIMNWIKSTV